jgi:virginiamycin B lyase
MGMGGSARRATGLAVSFALSAWIVCAGSALAAPTITEFPVKTANQYPLGIAAGPDGAIWFTELGADSIGRSTLTGTMTEFTGLEGPAYTIVTGAEGDLWFAEQSAGKIGRITPQGTGLKQFSLPSGSAPLDIVAGPEGDLWFTEQGGDGAIGRIDPVTEAIEEFTEHLTPKSRPEGITVGPEGDLWFTQPVSPGEIGRITPSGAITEFSLPTAGTDPRDIVAGADGNLWFTQSAGSGEIGRITPAGQVTEFTEGLTTDAEPLAIAAGNDGNVYFTEPRSGEVGEITPAGEITELTPLTSSSMPDDIATGPDGNIWFTELADPGRITILTVAPKVGATGAVDVADDSATLQASVGPNSQASTYEFEYGTTSSYGSHTPPSSAGDGASSVAESAPVSGLSADTEYHFRVAATNATGTTYGPDRTFTTESAPVVVSGEEETDKEANKAKAGSEQAVSPGITPSTVPALTPLAPIVPPPPAPPVTPPALGHTAVAQVLAGTVLIRLPGSRTAVPLTAGDIPVGALVDAEHGTVVVTTAVNLQGLTQPATVWGGSFVLEQSSASGGMTTFVDQASRPSGCLASRHAGRIADVATTAKRHEASTTLWSKDDNGHFSTRGQNSVATVRGTYWGTEELCNGTLTTVRRGLVSVRSLHTHRTVLVSAGHNYLARP